MASAMVTSAPRSTRRIASAEPMKPIPPVISARLPANRLPISVTMSSVPTRGGGARDARAQKSARVLPVNVSGGEDHGERREGGDENRRGQRRPPHPARERGQ